MFYAAFKPVDSFGLIIVQFEGDDAPAIGLSKEDLTDFLKLRFKNNFAKIPLRDPGTTKMGELYFSKKGRRV